MSVVVSGTALKTVPLGRLNKPFTLTLENIMLPLHSTAAMLARIGYAPLVCIPAKDDGACRDIAAINASLWWAG